MERLSTPIANCWTADQVALQLRQAAAVVRAHDAHQEASRPGVARAACSAVAPARRQRYSPAWHRPVAPQTSVHAADAVLAWAGWIEDLATRRIVLARAHGARWRQIEDLDGRSRPTLMKYHAEGLARIAACLNSAAITRAEEIRARERIQDRLPCGAGG